MSYARGNQIGQTAGESSSRGSGVGGPASHCCMPDASPKSRFFACVPFRSVTIVQLVIGGVQRCASCGCPSDDGRVPAPRVVAEGGGAVVPVKVRLLHSPTGERDRKSRPSKTTRVRRGASPSPERATATSRPVALFPTDRHIADTIFYQDNTIFVFFSLFDRIKDVFEHTLVSCMHVCKINTRLLSPVAIRWTQA